MYDEMIFYRILRNKFIIIVLKINEDIIFFFLVKLGVWYTP